MVLSVSPGGGGRGCQSKVRVLVVQQGQGREYKLEGVEHRVAATAERSAVYISMT